MLKSVARTAGVVVGFAVIAAMLYGLKVWVANDPALQLKREIASANHALRSEMQLDGHISVQASLDPNAKVGAKVEYLQPIPLADRRNIIVKTNILVRRYVHDLGEVKVVFHDGESSGAEEMVQDLRVYDPDAGALPVPRDAPVVMPPPTQPPPVADEGVPALPGMAKKNVKPAKKASRGPTGQLTLVVFPEAQVFRGKDNLGRTPLFNAELPVGTHLLTVVGDDGVKRKLSVPVRADKPTQLKVKLDELPVK